ncbi:MAG: hypothetical protein U0X40_04695 [Ferruginibacter sp.]
MKLLPAIHIIFSLLLLPVFLTAQTTDISGVWEGYMGGQFGLGNRQFLQLNIVQKGSQLCGYTFDSVINRKHDFCKALFDGRYDKKKKVWILTGRSFLANSGTHILMRIVLSRDRWMGDDKMEAEVSSKADSMGPTAFDRSFAADLQRLGIRMVDALSMQMETGRDVVQLRKVADKPAPMPPGVPACFDIPVPSKDSTPVILQPIPKTDTPRVVTEIPRINKADSQAVINPLPENNGRPDSLLTTEAMQHRKNVTFSRLPVNVKELTLSLYDNAIVDDDTITVFYNGRMLVSHQKLSVKPIVINLLLDENASKHELVLFADNLGSIPPNTALIVVNAGTKRYELHSSANLTENAVLVFEYAPDH